MEGGCRLKLAPKVKGVKYLTLIMLAVSVFFIIPIILYVLEGGYGIAVIPFILAAASIVTAIGLYKTEKMAWFAALIIGLFGALIFMADWVNVNAESILGSIMCIILLIDLVLQRKYYLTE